MRTNRTTAAAAVGLVAALAGAVALGAPAAMGAAPGSAPAAAAPNAASPDATQGRPDFAAVGVTANDTLVSFETDYPRRVETIGKLKLADDASVIGMDFRVQDDTLYAVGNDGGIYTVSLSDAVTTKVSQLSVALSGTTFGVDFNPAADRLRVISDTGQNLRHDVTLDTTTVDGVLTYPAVPPGDPTPGVGITAAAYTNNDLDPNTATTLFDIDTALDQVVLQSPANSGMLASAGKLTVDAGTEAGFDIYTRIRKDRAYEVEGYAVLSVGGEYGGYRVNVLTGEVKKLRSFPGKDPVVDVALFLDQR